MNRVLDLTGANAEGGSSDQESGSELGSVKQKLLGRPVNYFRATYFKQRDDKPKVQNRVTVECILCTETMESRTEKSQEHVLEKCKKITWEQRAEAEKRVEASVKPTAGKRPPTSLSRTTSKKDRQEQQGVSSPMGQYLHGNLTKHQQLAINRKLLRLVVTTGMSFRVVESPFFLDFVASLNVKYNPAGEHRHHS